MATMNPDFAYEDLLPLGHDETEYRLVTNEGVTTTEVAGRTFITVDRKSTRLNSSHVSESRMPSSA